MTGPGSTAGGTGMIGLETSDVGSSEPDSPESGRATGMSAVGALSSVNTTLEDQRNFEASADW